MPWLECLGGQSKAEPPTPKSQVRCYAGEAGQCGKDQYQYEVEENDEQGSGISGNDDGTSGQIICTFIEQCPIGFYVTVNATSNEDVECESCLDYKDGKFFSTVLDAQHCTQWKTCKVDEYWHQPSGSTTSDITCLPCPPMTHQPLQNERKTGCTRFSPTTTLATTTFPSGNDDDGGSGERGEDKPDKANLGLIIGASCGGMVVFLSIAMLIRRCSRRRASYLTANEWSDNGRSWRGGFQDDEEDSILLGGL